LKYNCSEVEYEKSISSWWTFWKRISCFPIWVSFYITVWIYSSRGTFDVDEHREIAEISKEDMIQLAAMLLAEVFD